MVGGDGKREGKRMGRIDEREGEEEEVKGIKASM